MELGQLEPVRLAVAHLPVVHLPVVHLPVVHLPVAHLAPGLAALDHPRVLRVEPVCLKQA